MILRVTDVMWRVGVRPKGNKISLTSFQLVHGPSTKTRVAYILSLLRQPASNGNESTVMEEDEESDVEDGDITMLNAEVIYSALVGELNIYSSQQPLL